MLDKSKYRIIILSRRGSNMRGRIIFDRRMKALLLLSLGLLFSLVSLASGAEAYAASFNNATRRANASGTARNGTSLISRTISERGRGHALGTTSRNSNSATVFIVAWRSAAVTIPRNNLGLPQGRVVARFESNRSFALGAPSQHRTLTLTGCAHWPHSWQSQLRPTRTGNQTIDGSAALYLGARR